MRLSKKSKAILELLFITGMDALEALVYIRSGPFGYSNPESERSFRRQLKAMETIGWISLGNEDENANWVPKITELGRDLINDDIDPEAAWNADWDGQWTSIAFDIPANARDQRWQLDQWLGKRRFGHMQGSLWISHRANEDFAAELANRNVDLHSVVVTRGRFLSTQSPEEIAHAAWDFDTINGNYNEYLNFLKNHPPPTEPDESKRDAIAQWLQDESLVWRTAFESDPFLPKSLLPSDYLGKTAWTKRRETCRLALKP